MKIWELELAQKNCVVMRVGNMFPAHIYNLNGHILPIQSCFKDVGITFSENMCFNIHINNICNKTYLIINRLFRCFITNNYMYIPKAYISYVKDVCKGRTMYVLHCRKSTWHSPDGKTHNQIDFILTPQRFKYSINKTSTRTYSGVDIYSDHDFM